MLDLRLAGFGPLSDMGVRTSTPQVHVWFQPLSARAQSAPRSTRSTAWQAQRGCDHHPLAREDLAFALSVVLLGLLAMVTRISQATAGGMGVSCVSTPRPTAQASRRTGFKAPLRQDRLSASSLVQAQSLNIGPRGGLGFGSGPKRSGRDRYR